jgi:signal transduction histidine kinase
VTRDAGAAATLALTLLALAGLVAASGPASLLRHAFLVPVTIAALRFGLAGGGLAAAAAGALQAPGVFAELAANGATAAAAEALAGVAVVLLVGTLAGVLADGARQGRGRYETLLAVHAALGDDPPLDTGLARVRNALRARLGADVALVVADEAVAVSGGAALAPGSAAARVLAGGRPLFVADAGGGARPRRAFVAPLATRAPGRGVLVVEREGELGAGERVALTALAVHVGLALENARLRARHRRAAEELQERVAAATERLAAMDRTKSAFVALASHELRTPLTALLGFAELLAVREFPPAEVRRLAAILREETARLVRIVDDFLDLDRLERGLPPELARRPLAVGRAVAAAVDVFRRGVPTHRFEVRCEEPLPAVEADPDALDRILKNLVSNAVKYSPRGSAVTVSARGVGAGAVELAVTDEGRGIPPDVRERVFEPYFRVPASVGAARGAGLGLAVVKSLVDAHGGTIAVDGAHGPGTRITLVFPALP